MGKTAFVLSMARNAAVMFNKPVAFFSLEMSSLQLVNRLISSEAEIPSDKIRKGQLAQHEWEQLNVKIKPLTQAPIYIDDTPALSIFEFRAKCRRLVAEKKVECIIIDYLQLMVAGSENKAGNREQEISLISRSLKAVAKELSVPVIALSQLSRAVETRGSSKKPQLSDLRESGAIEQDADMVMFIYRPEYYGLSEDENANSTLGMAEVSVAKHRNGALRDVRLKFIGQFTKFTDADDFDFQDDSPLANAGGYERERVTRGSRLNDMGDDPNMPF
jgi:replicative DNA helicase